MKGYLSLNLIPPEKLRRHPPALPWVVALVALLVLQGAGAAAFYTWRVEPSLAQSQQQLSTYERQAESLQVNRAKLEQLSATIQEARTLSAELQRVHRDAFDWTTLTGLLAGAAGENTQLGQVTVIGGGAMHLTGMAVDLAALNSFVDSLPPENFQQVFVNSVQVVGAIGSSGTVVTGNTGATGSSGTVVTGNTGATAIVPAGLQFTLTATYVPPGGISK